MDKPKRIYWDSCIFISYISGENRDQFEVAGIDDVVKDVDLNKIILVTSVVSRVEVLKDLGDKREKYIAVLQNPNIQEIDVNKVIGQMAGDIRYQFQQAGKNRLTTPDAVHLATALWAEVDEFHTFDGCGKPPGLLDLNGHTILKGLKIVKPHSTQPYLGPDFK
jgi:predicted nucleic acid-binding protein